MLQQYQPQLVAAGQMPLLVLFVGVIGGLVAWGFTGVHRRHNAGYPLDDAADLARCERRSIRCGCLKLSVTTTAALSRSRLVDGASDDAEERFFRHHPNFSAAPTLASACLERLP